MFSPQRRSDYREQSLSLLSTHWVQVQFWKATHAFCWRNVLSSCPQQLVIKCLMCVVCDPDFKYGAVHHLGQERKMGFMASNCERFNNIDQAIALERGARPRVAALA